MLRSRCRRSEVGRPYAARSARLQGVHSTHICPEGEVSTPEVVIAVERLHDGIEHAP